MSALCNADVCLGIRMRDTSRIIIYNILLRQYWYLVWIHGTFGMQY
jgi:hypothetical protein